MITNSALQPLCFLRWPPGSWRDDLWSRMRELFRAYGIHIGLFLLVVFVNLFALWVARVLF